MSTEEHTAPRAEAAIPWITPAAVALNPVPDGAELDHPSLYFSRELSWLDFNWRVLQQARDPRTPLLERVRFVAITAANLDEFFQKYVGGLKRQETAGLLSMSRDGRADQLRLIRTAAQQMHQAMTETWERDLKPRLRGEAELVVSDYGDLRPPQQQALSQHFRDQIYPVLTPLAVDPGHPFPFISNLSLSLAVLMRHAARDTVHFARIKVPAAQGRWLAVPESFARFHFVPVEQVIQANVASLFPGMQVESVHAFRITRSAAVEKEDEDLSEDLLAVISEELRERRFAPVVRLEVDAGMPQQVRAMLARELELRDDDVYEMGGLIAPSDCMELADLDVPAHRFDPWEPVVPTAFQHEGETEEERNIFAIIRREDILVHHPYDSFSASVQRLVDEAADDPAVLAIKQTLYRMGNNSPIVKALLRAAERGKQVAVLVEVTARFDEANNMQWAEVLEDAGVHVTYGLVGLKTHSKVTLVVRYEEGRPRTYCHIGTGNYHARTTRLYSDLGLLTCDPAIGFDMVNLFHFLTGYAPDQQYSRVVVAPRDMRRVFEERIRREVQVQESGGTGRIIAKLNALDDFGIIQELYRASRAGVQIDLIVRGHSRLRPGVRGYSDNIRVVSIVGRFLEHDRIYYFQNGGEPEIFIGSADWRHRNLAERVEAVVPVLNPALQERLVQILHYALLDNRLSWELRADGRYVQRRPEPGEPEVNYHALLMRDALDRTRSGSRPWEVAEG
ncbi:MAG TPA: polyphosphate kinase 1 [Longimicrobiaceae bacterium]|jgi:polyphosphate kinase|nr:polyphosphate kinase 1 [Longimicrobiaceae bacterium]